MGDIDERSRTNLFRGGPWKLYNFERTGGFDGIRITLVHDCEETNYRISMFGENHDFDVNQFDKIVNSEGIAGLYYSFMEMNRGKILDVIDDNDAYFIFKRALQEAKKEDLKIRERN